LGLYGVVALEDILQRQAHVAITTDAEGLAPDLSF
jgi:hypothetical protein